MLLLPDYVGSLCTGRLRTFMTYYITAHHTDLIRLDFSMITGFSKHVGLLQWYLDSPSKCDSRGNNITFFHDLDLEALKHKHDFVLLCRHRVNSNSVCEGLMLSTKSHPVH